MENIRDITIKPITESKYIKPHRVFYTQNGKQKAWDAMKVHDSVAILIHNISRDVFVYVKQFRPAVFINIAEINHSDDGTGRIDPDKFPGSLGITHELCAGIVDKDVPNNQIAQEEVLEETGYKVPLDSIEKITSFRSGVGVSGSQQTMYYVAVTDAMKTGPGGGNPREGELIEVVEIPVKDSLKFAMDENNNKPVGMMFALLWFDQFKAKND